MKYQIPKGLNDIIPSSQAPKEAWQTIEHWQYVEELLKRAAHLFGYREIRTPIFERTELFTRSSGDSSDIVFKEMYTFIDKGERSMTLRPEGTAAVMRSIIENGVLHENPLQKLYYIGPFFRYDRPQAGRYRQFHHFGVEALGVEGAELDAEVIDLLFFIFNSLSIKGTTLLINTIGTDECRKNYSAALKSFLSPMAKELSEDSQKRLEANPLRILDSKDPKDQSLILHAPKLSDFLSADSENHFNRVLALLTLLKIPYKIEPKLVRGLDYYNHTVFEFVSDDLGAQSTIGAGGRYDGLSAKLGGEYVSSVGFAIGLERLIQILVKQNIPYETKGKIDLFLIPIGEVATSFTMQLAHTLRQSGISTEVYLKGGKLNKALSFGDKLQASYRAVIGDNEIASSQVVLKNLLSKEEKPLSFDQLASYITQFTNC